jgi:hypothetical protein
MSFSIRSDFCRRVNETSSTFPSVLYIQKTRSILAQSITLSLNEFVALLRSTDHDSSSAHHLTAMQRSNPLSYLSFGSQVVLADVLPVDLVSRAIALIGGLLRFALRFSPTPRCCAVAVGPRGRPLQLQQRCCGG